jgi:hypothetical protein
VWLENRSSEDIRSLGLVNYRLMMNYTPRCRCGVQADDSPTMDCPDVCLKVFWLQELEWVLEDFHKRSCRKNSIGVSVPRPCESDVYVCSKSCRLCLTVIYWLFEYNKLPLWNRTCEFVTILFSYQGSTRHVNSLLRRRSDVTGDTMSRWSPGTEKRRKNLWVSLNLPSTSHHSVALTLAIGE